MNTPVENKNKMKAKDSEIFNSDCFNNKKIKY